MRLEPVDKEAEIRRGERGAGVAEVRGGEEVPDVDLVEQDVHPRGQQPARRMLTGGRFFQREDRRILVLGRMVEELTTEGIGVFSRGVTSRQRKLTCAGEEVEQWALLVVNGLIHKLG